jgi:sec-independent protein translocase protein TatA
MDIGVPELLIILAIIIILFGPSRLAGAGKSLGEAIRGFRQELRNNDPPQHHAASPDRPNEPTVS